VGRLAHAALGTVLLAWLTAGAAHAAEPPAVLLIYADPRLLPAVVTMDQTLRATIEAGLGSPVRFYTEYLDLSWFPEGQERHVGHTIEQKYVGRRFDLVVPCGESALRFALRQRDALFPGAPIVFCTVEDARLDGMRLPPDVTGVTMFRDWAAGLALILQLHPRTRRIVFVSGAGPVETGWEQLARAAFVRYQGRLAFTYLSGLPIADTVTAVRALREGDVVVFNVFLRDGAGRTLSSPEALGLLGPAASVPMYGFAETQIGHGIVGGPLVSYEGQARGAGELAVRILRGERLGPSDIVRRLPSAYVFDARQLWRWRIDENRLPPGSVVQFQVAGFWQHYKWQALGAAGVLLVQTLLVIGLLAERGQTRKARAGLEESESRFRLMADAAPVMVWLAGPDGRCIDFNRAWLDFTGRTLAHEVGHGWLEAVHPEDRGACEGRYLTALAARQPFTMEFRLRRSDDVYRVVLDTGVPRFDASRGFQGYIGSATDITEVKAAQHSLVESLALREELAHALRVATVGELTASIAHEINQPLTAIATNAVAARNALAGAAIDAEVPEMLRDIVADAHRAAQIIRALRALFRKAPAERKPVDVGEVVKDVLGLVHQDLEQQRIELDVCLQSDAPRVTGDVVQLQQVILNVLLNAAAAMTQEPGPRHLAIEVGVREPGVLGIAVRDSGPGVAAARLERIFDPFVSSKPDGLGMGLAITRSIVEAHGGRIRATPNADRGLTLDIELPC
jgi:PAS domain S-box-containing protein